MKKFNILLLLLFFMNSLNSISRIDKLEKKLKTVVAEEKIKTLNSLSVEYRYINPDKSIEYGNDALALALKYKDNKQKCIAYDNIATANAILGKYDQSLKYYLFSLESAEQHGDVDAIINDLEKIADVYNNWEKYEEAIEYYNKLMKIFEFRKDKESIARTFNNIGKVHKKSGNLNKAYEFFLRAIKFEEENVHVLLRDDYLHYSEVYAAIGNDDKALEFYKLYTTMKDTIESALSSQKIEIMQKRYDEEKKQREIEILMKDKEISELELRQLTLEKEKNEKELIALRRNQQIEMLKKDNAIRDLELKQARYEKDEIKEKVETYKKDKEINELELEKIELEVSKQKTLQSLYFLIGFLLLISALFGFYQAHSRNAANKELGIVNAELANANDKLELIAKTDPLTNLSNRRDMIEKIENEQKRFGRNGKSFVLVMSDIDGFKSVNDKYGHDGGDFVLESLAKLMQSVVRKQDVVGRWGGEEFLILLPETKLEGGRALAEKIRKNISVTPYVFSDKKIPITMNFGVSVYNIAMDIDICIKKADEALYRGKKRGKNCVVISKPDEEEQSSTKIDVDSFSSG